MSFKKIERHGQDNVYTCYVCGHSDFSVGMKNSLFNSLFGTRKMYFQTKGDRYGWVVCEKCLPNDAEVEWEWEDETECT
jgi:hypothetical protein